MNQVLRALSIHEASFPVYADLCPGVGNIVVCLKLHGALSLLQAELGFSHLMQAEPTLQVASQWRKENSSEGIKAGYVFLKPEYAMLPFSSSTVTESAITQTNTGTDSFEEEVLRIRTSFLNKPFQEGSLLWRAHLISQVSNGTQQHCVLMCINHSVSDGASVYQLMKQWLLALNEPTKVPVTDKQLSQPLWHYMPKKIAGVFGAFRALGVLSTFVKAQKLADQGLSFKADYNVPISEHRCRSTYRLLKENSFSKLLLLSKNNNKSIHGLVSAALMQVLLTDCKNSGQLNKLANTFSFPFVTTVNVRDKIFRKEQNAVNFDTEINGCYSSGVTSMVTVDKNKIENEYAKSPWVLGEQVSTGVKAALQQDQHWKVLRIYQLAGLKGLKKMFIDSSEKPLATPLSFANLGPVNFSVDLNDQTFKTSSDLTVTDYQAYAAFHASGAGVNVVASSLNGELTLCLTCPAPVISQLTLDQYADDVIKLLECWAYSLI
jgi:hypothetical protein